MHEGAQTEPDILCPFEMHSYAVTHYFVVTSYLRLSMHSMLRYLAEEFWAASSLSTNAIALVGLT